MDIQAGDLLVAEPFMKDPNFKRTVVLICEHNAEGSFGLVLNRKLEFNITDIMEDFPYMETPVFYGGPVSPDTLHYVHAYGDALEGSIRIRDGLFWGGNFEQLKLLIETGHVQPEHIRFFVGYSGWSPGQLEEEMTINSWIISRSFDNVLMDSDALWKVVLHSMGGDYKFVSNFPEDPTLN